MISFRPVTRDDYEMLLRWRNEPLAQRWWGSMSKEQMEAEYGRHIDGDETTQFFIAAEDGRDFGMIERYLIADHPDWDRQVQVPAAAGLDYLIGESDLIGRGLGPRMIDAAVDEIFATFPRVDSVAVGVLIENRRSWRALEKAGFTRLREQFLESDEPVDRGPGYLYVRSRA